MFAFGGLHKSTRQQACQLRSLLLNTHSLKLGIFNFCGSKSKSEHFCAELQDLQEGVHQAHELFLTVRVVWYEPYGHTKKCRRQVCNYGSKLQHTVTLSHTRRASINMIARVVLSSVLEHLAVIFELTFFLYCHEPKSE